MSVNKQSHKYTGFCPIKKCDYTSRIPIIANHILTNKNSVHSKLCPTHRTVLISQYEKNKLFK